MSKSDGLKRRTEPWAESLKYSFADKRFLEMRWSRWLDSAVNQEALSPEICPPFHSINSPLGAYAKVRLLSFPLIIVISPQLIIPST